MRRSTMVSIPLLAYGMLFQVQRAVADAFDDGFDIDPGDSSYGSDYSAVYFGLFLILALGIILTLLRDKKHT